MKNLIKTILVLGIIAGIMLFTCPEKEKHVDKVTKEFVHMAQEDVGANSSNAGIVEEIIGEAIGSSISESLIHLYVKNTLKVDDYKVVTVGKMTYEGDDRIVTIGAFGRVFSLLKLYQ